MSRMNANIILAGQQPDFVNTLARSNQAAAFKNEMNRQNALTQIYQQYGPQIMQGDPRAMNVLAQHDTGLAMDMQGARQQMDFNAEKMQMLRDKARMDTAKMVFDMDQTARAEQAKKLQGVLSGAAHFYSIGDQGGYNAWLEQNGVDPAQYPFDAFPAHAAKGEGVLEALTTMDKRNAGPEPADEYGRYVQEELAAGRQPLSRIEYGRAKQKTQNIEVGADGSVRLSEGFGGEGDVKFTETQAKDNVYSTRARGALEVLEPVADALASRGDKILGGIPLGIGREIQDPDYQVAEQAGTEFLQAILRKDTGAAITQGEIDSYGATYLPQPGDGPAVLDAKRNARARAIAALESGMNASQMLARDRALVKAAEETGQVKTAPSDFSQMSEDELLQVDPGSLEGEQQKAFIKALEDALNGR